MHMLQGAGRHAGSVGLLEDMPRHCMQARGRTVQTLRASAGRMWRPLPCGHAFVCGALTLLPAEPLPCAPAHHQPRPGFFHLQEQRGERLLVRAGLLLAALQLACTYVVWGAAVQRAQHQRHHERWE